MRLIRLVALGLLLAPGTTGGPAHDDGDSDQGSRHVATIAAADAAGTVGVRQHVSVCSLPFALPDSSVELRVCPRDRVEIVGGTQAGLDHHESPIIVGRFNAEASTPHTHLFNVGGEPCASGGGVYEAEVIFTCCLMHGEPSRCMPLIHDLSKGCSNALY